ncbi:MAG: glycosyltransferase family 2 protein [Actinomycetota bacterium]|nr:glycosyltransferase family 2 protein [Actinomycetota bacterium]
MKLVSIVLINFNSTHDLARCIGSAESQDYENLELIAIDNGSSDNSYEVLTEILEEDFWKNRSRLIRNEKNIGFSPALNQGIRLSKGELVMSLNPDVVLEPDFISKLADAFDEPRVGSASGKLLRFPAGKRGNVIDSAGHIIYRNRLSVNRGEGMAGGRFFNAPEFVFGTCGAAAMYSREMLDDVAVLEEYFDEDFFAFWEDLDLDWRAGMRGWKCAYRPDAIAYHRRGGAGYRKSLLVEYHNYKNRYLMIIKNDSARYLLKNLPGIVLTEVLKGGALLVRCPRALLSLWEVVKLLPKILKKRRIIQSKRVVSPREMEIWFESFPYRSWIKRHLFERGEMIAQREGA